MATYGRNNAKMRKLADRGLNAVQIGAQLGCSRMTVSSRLAGGKNPIGLWSRLRCQYATDIRM